MNPFSKQFIYYRLPVIGFCVLIFWQSSYPGVISEPFFPHDDKVIHFIIYTVLSALTARALEKEALPWSIKHICLAAMAFSIIFGLSDEIHQAFVPSRCASFFDFLADCGGSMAGSLFMAGYFSKARPMLKKHSR